MFQSWLSSFPGNIPVREIWRQKFLELTIRPLDKRVDGGRGTPDNFGDLPARKTLVSFKDDSKTLVGRKTLKGIVDNNQPLISFVFFGKGKTPWRRAHIGRVMIFIRLILLPAVFYREVSVDFHSREICLVHQDKAAIANE